MQKNFLRDYIKNLLRKIDKTNKYHPNVIDHAIEKAINSIFAEIAIKRPHELDAYTKEYDLTLVRDGTSQNYYTTLTAPYVPIPDKRGGIRHIETQGDFAEIIFVPVTQSEFYRYPNTYSAMVSDRVPYYVDNTKIYFYNPNDVVTAADVTVHQVIPFTSYADTDTIKIPDGQDHLIVKLALEHLGIIQPVDLANDNNDTIEQ